MAGPAPPTQSGIVEVNSTKEAEDSYDLAEHRKGVVLNPIGSMATAMHLTKAALGSGLLGGPAAYKTAGYAVALAINVFIGIYFYICLNLLGNCSQTVCKRIATPVLSYGQLGEAIFVLSKKPTLIKCSKCMRYLVDTLIMAELFGACITYQLIISKTTQILLTNFDIDADMNRLLGIYMIPIVLLCLIRNLSFLAPFSIVANGIIALIAITNVYYASKLSPGFSQLKASTDVAGFFRTVGILTFSMSCACQILTVENNMRQPKDFSKSVAIGLSSIVSIVLIASFFGYVAFGEEVENPILNNYPKTDTYPKILRGLLVIMIIVTHALNYYVPFSRAWAYIVPHVHFYHLYVEILFRILICLIITNIAFIIKDISGLMGLLGSFCLSNMGFIMPSLFDIVMAEKRPGYGAMKYRLFGDLVLLIIGLCIFFIGTYFALTKLLNG